jgi:histone-lysine N-methyltransferase SETD2
VVDKFHGKLPKEELKKFAREVNKKLVASDYKNKRVDDPTAISPKQAKKVKKYAHDFFDRAVVKYTEYEKKKTALGGAAGKPPTTSGTSQPSEAASSTATPLKDDVTMSDVEGDLSPGSSTGRKRKRGGDDEDRVESPDAPPSETPSVKRVKEDDAEAEVEGEPSAMPPSPPTPPPPPMDTPPTEEERSMREQEEALIRENEEAEEAQRLEDEAAHQARGEGDGGKRAINGAAVLANGSASAAGVAETDMDVDAGTPPQQAQAQKRQQTVLSH